MSKNNNSSRSKNGPIATSSKKGREKKLPVETIIDIGSNKSVLPTRPSSSLALNGDHKNSNQFIEVNNKKHSNSSNNKKSHECISYVTLNNGMIAKADPMEKPFEFLSLKYPNVTLREKNTVAVRSKCSNNVIFFNRPMKPGEKIILKVLKTDKDPQSSFLLGLTTCGVSKIETYPKHLIEFCKPFFSCGGYSIHNHVNYANAVGDVIEIERLKVDGSLRVRTNGKISGIRDKTDGARFKTANAVPFLNLNLGVSSLEIVRNYDSQNIHDLKHNSEAVVVNGVTKMVNSTVKKAVIQSVNGPSRSPLDSTPASLGGDLNIIAAPMKPLAPPPGFDAKIGTNRVVPFSEYMFNFDIRTPSPSALPSPSEVNEQSRPTFSQLFQNSDKIADDPKTIRRPSSEFKVVPNSRTLHAGTNIGNKEDGTIESERKTNHAALCDIDKSIFENSSSNGNETDGISKKFTNMFPNPRTSPVFDEKWITSKLVLVKDMYTIERDEQVDCDWSHEGRFYAFLKQPFEKNTRVTFKIKKVLDSNRVKKINPFVRLNYALTIGVTNAKIPQMRSEVDLLPVDPWDCGNRSYEEWYFTTNPLLDYPFVGMVFHLERHADGQVFAVTETVPVEGEEPQQPKLCFNLCWCGTEYYLWLALHGIVSSVEVLAITKLSTEHSNNVPPALSLNGALNDTNLAKCIRCKGAQIEWAPDDCSHRSYCESCARLLAKKQANCLVCGSPITSVQRIFI